MSPRAARPAHRPAPRRSAGAASARALSALLAAVLAAALTGCASGPPPPDWQAQASAAMDSAIAAYLAGHSEAEARDFERARRQISRTGRANLLARAELMRCAAHVASLVFEPCAGFEALRRDAAPAERAYADHLAGRVLTPEQIALLPPAQRAAASAVAGAEGAAAGVGAIDDPQSRLIAIAVLFQSGKAPPTLLSSAVDTASAQGWRRPLLAWLGVQALRAERAGEVAEAQRLRRRIELALERR